VKPVLALVGRPNVGKSTLFNRITRSRTALVHDMPGLTRDRQYGEGRAGPCPCIVIDTGGFDPADLGGLQKSINRQAELAISESDVLIFLVDARAGPTAHDRRIGERLRASGRRILLAVNKAEGLGVAAAAEFHELGLGEPHLLSAAHGDGVGDLLQVALGPFLSPRTVDEEAGGAVEPEEGGDETLAADAPRRIKVAFVGRPNVGKSTLVNGLLGEERMIAFDAPGTTRDAVEIEFERGGQSFILVDTAGVRRKGKVFEAVEKFSVVKTLQAIDQCSVAVLLLDAASEIAEQDAHIASYILDRGRALVIAVNKWDSLPLEQRERIDRELDRKLNFLHWARIHRISALRGSGLSSMLRSVVAAHRAAYARLPTPKLTRALRAAVERQEPARSGNVRPKMRYAHLGGSNPPLIVIHGSALSRVQDSYRRFLEGWFRREFELEGTPLRIEFRSSSNPYVESRARPRAGKARSFPVD